MRGNRSEARAAACVATERQLTRRSRGWKAPLLPVGAAFRQEVDETAHLCRQVTAARVHGGDRGTGRRVAGQQRHQATGPHLRGQDKVRLEHDTHAGDRHRDQHPTVVGPVSKRDLRRGLRPVGRFEGPRAGGRGVQVREAIMLRELVRSSGRGTVLQIVGGRAADEPRRADPT